MLTLAALPLTLASLAAALSGTNNNNPPALGNAAVDTNAVEIQAIESHFHNAGIVPGGLPSFNPSALIVANYAGVGNISPGQSLTRAQVGPAPSFTVTPANSSVSLSGNYTLAMVDFDAVGSNLSGGVTRHWLVNGVTIDSSSISNTSAVAITTYAGPAPPAGTGPHRYAFLLWAQPQSFRAPEAFSQPNMGVSKFDVNAYVKDSGLGALVAGSYITVEEGTATVSLSATSAVVTSTLPAATASTTSLSHGTPSPLPSQRNNAVASDRASYALMALAAITLAFIA